VFRFVSERGIAFFVLFFKLPAIDRTAWIKEASRREADGRQHFRSL